MSFGIWLAFYVFLGFLVGRLYGSFIGWKFVRIAFIPGVALAALGRQIACILTGTNAKECDTWRAAGPAESRGGPPGGTGFRLLFAVAPFALALVGVLVLEWALDRPVSFSAELPRISTDPGKAGKTFFETCLDFSYGMWDAVKGQKLGDASFWIYAYLAASFVIGCAPSVDDLKAIGVACGVVIIASIACEFLGVEVAVVHLYRGAFWRGFSLLVAYTNFILVCSAILLLPVKLLRDSRKEK
jgi:hypothetical protein